MTMKQSTVSMRIRIENLCIGIIFLFSLMLFRAELLPPVSAEAAVLVSTEMGWMVQRAVSVLLFCLVSQLKKRKRAAYDITLLLLLLSLLRGVRQLTPASVLISVIDLLLLAAFLLLPQGFLLPGRTKGPKTQSVCPSAERARRTGQRGEEARFALTDYEISGKRALNAHEHQPCDQSRRYGIRVQAAGKTRSRDRACV